METVTVITDEALQEYCRANVNHIFTQGYDEHISDKEAQMLLEGRFEAFDESLQERLTEWEVQGYLWSYWEEEFCRHFDFDAWDEVPEEVRETVEELRVYDASDWIKTMIKQWRGNITVTIHKPGAKSPEDLIYAPSGDLDDQDKALARYLIDAFGLTLKEGPGSKAERLIHDLDVIYGGYDREVLTLIGRLDLFAIYEAQKAPKRVTIGPEDADHLIFYEHHNGCGNMGCFRLTKTRTMPASFRVDGTWGYGVDSCYGFTGQHWNHPIRIA